MHLLGAVQQFGEGQLEQRGDGIHRPLVGHDGRHGSGSGLEYEGLRRHDGFLVQPRRASMARETREFGARPSTPLIQPAQSTRASRSTPVCHTQAVEQVDQVFGRDIAGGAPWHTGSRPGRRSNCRRSAGRTGKTHTRWPPPCHRYRGSGRPCGAPAPRGRPLQACARPKPACRCRWCRPARLRSCPVPAGVAPPARLFPARSGRRRDRR